ncbi:MAG: ribbon-helix-helix protein, CopG family [Desulfatiglandaceae bacterium]
MKTVSFKLPELLIEQISSLASKSGESRSSLIRKAIESLVRKTNAQNQTSCLDLARDLAGAVAGPDDLSYNAEHLTSYGR